MALFREMLQNRWSEGKLVCTGLDPDVARLPYAALGVDSELLKHLIDTRDFIAARDVQAEAIVEFNQRIVVATWEVACAYKPNLAWYLQIGAPGIEALQETCRFIRTVVRDVPIILDGKTGDIDNTNNGYAAFAFDVLGVDAITVPPYMGAKSLQPILDYPDKGVFVLCRTSNEGADEFQRLDTLVHDAGPGWEQPLYERVARNVASGSWNANGNCGIVAGATYPGDLKYIRELVGDSVPILIPGVGAQGGDVLKAVRAGINSRGEGILIDSSREIIFASSGDDFDAAAGAATRKLHEQIFAARDDVLV